jgi:hypothetical protein
VPCSRSIAADRVVPRERSRLGFAVYALPPGGSDASDNQVRAKIVLRFGCDDIDNLELFVGFPCDRLAGQPQLGVGHKRAVINSLFIEEAVAKHGPRSTAEAAFEFRSCPRRPVVIMPPPLRAFARRRTGPV